MIRSASGAGAAMMASLALLVSACSEEEASPGPDEDLFAEYLESTDVENDRFPTPEDGGPRDRLANFAAQGTPQQVLNDLMSAFPCEADDEGSELGYDDGSYECVLTAPVGNAVEDVAGTDGEVFGRSVLAKHDDGSLELITLYVARGADDTTTLIDSTGETYSGGLDDFREHNDLLDADDLILAPEDITEIPGEGKLVTVSGHTASNSRPWLIAAIAAALLGAGVVLARALLALRRDATPADAASGDPEQRQVAANDAQSTPDPRGDAE